jgi:hypothetical protein
MEQEKNELDTLFVEKEATVSNRLLRDLLMPYVQLSADGEIIATPDFNNLNSEKKMLVILLAKKVLNLKLRLEEKTSPKEIQTITALPVGTVNPSLTSLATKRLVQSEKGKYWIPNFAISRINLLFSEK